MCLRVVASGQQFGTGTHVSVYDHLMQGDNDCDLSWPLIMLRLVNHRAVHGHIERIILLTNESVTSRVIGRELNTLGQGHTTFIAHSNLPCNSARNTEYLRNDSLRFRVTKVVLN